MIFHLSFFIFSSLLSYTDCTRLRIPNLTLITLFIFLVIFGYLEDQLFLNSFIVSLFVLIFFVIILILMPKAILGGGDIKYMMVIAIYLEPILFPLFLLVTGIVQLLFLIFFQKFKKRRTAPMAPAMFIAVILSKILFILEIY